ncbi:retron Se72 family effector protein [Ramlibacter tataouinensis]|uniref:retron Se72 family effector protein n=1 Tax=Ramlibacter tataouinensis TaxID=94132 RepID=UPI0022F38621|nr:retron Se72 family effector protein [Ramlibacter tataouinensis]WBY01523.1 retron Se72 family effector protein [Ramlibacter tataouinensis]
MDEKDQIGLIKVYYPVKGFGFITRTSGKDVFFYRDAADKEESLIEGSTVRFDVERTPKGPRATKVVRVS